MDWLQILRNRFHSTSSALVNKDGCDINFRSVPKCPVIIDVDELISQDQVIKKITDRQKICDIIVFLEVNDTAMMIFVEATTTRANLSKKLLSAIDQLESSIEHFKSASAQCQINFPLLKQYHVVVSRTSISSSIRSEKVKDRREQFRKKYRARVRIINSTQDIWNSIVGKTAQKM